MRTIEFHPRSGALALWLVCVPLLFFVSCSSDDGDDGASTGTVSGTVTNNLTGGGVGGAMVSTDPDVGGPVMTGPDGSYSLSLPVGNYTVSITADNFVPQDLAVSVLAARTSTVDGDLDPVAPVVVVAGAQGDATPGGTLVASVTVTPLDGSAVQTITWTQSNSVDVFITDPNSATTDVDLPDLSAYKEELFHVLSAPPIGEDELPENIELPEGEFPAGTPNRFGVVGVNPWALEEAGAVTLTATIVTDSGTYTEDVHIHAALPFKPSTGLNAVPIGTPVLLHGRAHVDVDADGVNDDTDLPTTYDWALTPPPGSAAALSDAAERDTWFTPDIVGTYTVTVTDTTQAPGTDVVTIEIEAARWQGAITGQDADGRPLAAGCTNCHDGVTAPDNFTDWAQTGHAEIFTDLINGSSYYRESCFGCHSVGYDPDADNGGFDDAVDFDEFLAAGILRNPSPDNWTNILADFPQTASLANVQCENCHGPQFGGSHPDVGNTRRTSLSADVCATCHGEPLRHARFQQWQLSGHANYEVAIDEGDSGNCSRCHTANGFLAWLPVLLDDDPETDPLDSVAVTWTSDQVHPQTCVTCHDPHAPGSTSGSDTNATVRISGNTPPLIAGFQVIGAGKGAICMTCHNSRRGIYNDDNPGDIASGARAPHGSAQTDMLMGQNAFFVEVGVRGNHSLVKDTCVNCHMRQTPPPDLLSYNSGGTNHTFAASREICSSCHGESFDAEGVADVFEALIDELKGLIELAIFEEIDAQTTAGNTVTVGGTGITDAATIDTIELTEYRGRQAIIVTLTDATVLGPDRLHTVDVTDGVGGDLGSLYDLIDQRVPRAGWNWALAHNDGSHGIHNPQFAQQILSAAIAEVNDVLGL